MWCSIVGGTYVLCCRHILFCSRALARFSSSSCASHKDAQQRFCWWPLSRDPWRSRGGSTHSKKGGSCVKIGSHELSISPIACRRTLSSSRSDIQGPCISTPVET